MKPWLRWALGASAAFAALALLLLWRLDTDELRAGIADHVSKLIGQTVRIGSLRPTLSHGLSFHIDRVDIEAADAGDFALEASGATIQLGLFKLLRGNIDITAIFLLNPRIELSDGEFELPRRLPTGLHLKQLKIQNGELWQSSRRQLASGVLLDMRDLEPNQDMRWEVSAEFNGGHLRSFGQTRLLGSTFVSLFGKMELAGIPMASLPTDGLPGWLLERQMACQLTFDLDRDGAWKADGDMDVILADHSRPDVHLRGTLFGSTQGGGLAWQEGYIHIGKKSVFRTSGEHPADGTLNIRLTGKDLSIEDILALGGVNHVRGLGTIDASAGFDGKSWRLDGDIGMRGWRWAAISQPDLVAKVQGADWRSGELRMTQAQVQHAKKSGLMVFKSLAWSPADLTMKLRLQAVEDWWMPLFRALLASQRPGANLDGDGLLTARIDLRSSDQGTDWQVTTDATAARVQISSIRKARGVAASGTLHVEQRNGVHTWRASDIQFGDSRLGEGEWIADGSSRRFRAREAQANATQLGELGVWEQLGSGKWHGRISGDMRGQWAGTGPVLASWPSWLASASAELTLDHFGLSDTWSGDLTLQDGQASARQLTWRSDGDLAMLSGQLAIASRRGLIDVDQAALTADRLAGIADWLAAASLDGTVRDTSLELKQNRLQEGKATYRLRDGSLKLTKLSARLAGGRLSADSLTIDLLDPAWPFSLPRMHADRLRLEDVAGLPGKPRGRLFATIGLSGRLRGSGWRANGDVDIFDGEVSGMNLAARIGELTGEPYGRHLAATSFARFSARFRLDGEALRLPRVSMRSAAFALQGAGDIPLTTLAPDIHLDATLLLPLQIGLKPGKSYVENDGSIHAPLVVSGRFPSLQFELNEPKLRQIQAMKAKP